MPPLRHGHSSRKRFVSLMKAMMPVSDTGKPINKVNKSVVWELLSINVVHSREWEDGAGDITANE